MGGRKAVTGTGSTAQVTDTVMTARRQWALDTLR